MVLIGAAFATELTGLAAVSTGYQTVPALAAVVDPHRVWRAELGLGTRRLQGYGVGTFTAWNSPWWLAQDPPLTLGDATLSEVGAGARWVPVDSLFQLAVRAELGAAFYSSPVTEQFWEDEGRPTVTGRASVGAWVGGGVDGGIAIVEDAIALQVCADTAWLTNPGIGLTLGVRLGVAARF